MPTAYPFIAIEGAIGAGKTTLARIIGESLPASVLLEVFEENPFLGDFYADRVRYAFQTQVFFLLSRYRQQHKVVTETLARGPLVSDYLFAKDWLFAHLNLAGDELAMYERVHGILGEKLTVPSLVIFLRATTDTLMDRIAVRDRPYERQMSRAYIDALRDAYESFFTGYSTAPVLQVETGRLDFVHDPGARRELLAEIKHALTSIAIQPAFPGWDEIAPQPIEVRGSLKAIQQLQAVQDGHPPGGAADPFARFYDLVHESGRFAAVLASAYRESEELLPVLGNRPEARDRALQEHGEQLKEQLGRMFVELIRLANGAGVDLEAAYLARKDSLR